MGVHVAIAVIALMVGGTLGTVFMALVAAGAAEDKRREKLRRIGGDYL